MVVKFTRSGLCDDPFTLRLARQCATHAALGPLDGASGAKKCYMHFLPRVHGHLCVAVVSDTEEQGPQGTNYMEQICNIVDGTYLACKGRFHVCGCISQLNRIEIRVCHQHLSVFRVNNTSETVERCVTRGDARRS